MPMPAVPRNKAETFASVEAFLAHDFADDLPRELIEGAAVAHAAPSSEHARIVANLSRAIGNALDAAGSSCFVEVGSGVRPARRRRPTHRVPDLMIRCPRSNPEPGEPEPVVVIEVLSPSNSATEMDEKARDYKSVPSIRQIVHLPQDRFFCSFQRKAGDLWVADEIEGPDAVLTIEAGITVALAAIYANVAIANENRQEAG
jgi:Uma2 family endonuclease